MMKKINLAITGCMGRMGQRSLSQQKKMQHLNLPL